MADNKLDFSLYRKRRTAFIDLLKKEHKTVEKGVVLLSANIETHDTFVQESSFYYLTGLEEPGVVCLLYFDGRQELYIPNCMQERAKWVKSPVSLHADTAPALGFDAIKILGEESRHYQLFPFSPEREYAALLHALRDLLASGYALFATVPNTVYGYLHQRLLLMRLQQWENGITAALVDCSSVIARMRQTKSPIEIEMIFKAIQITGEAQNAAATAIKDGANESEVQASLEYVITGNGAQRAFPSIVASGVHTTILHYHHNNHVMKKGDLVVVDIGASYKHYASDITRTYPVSGTFSKRQKEIYELVLETQEYIASIAQVGYYLRNNDQPDKSLHHLAIAYLEERGYGQYMPHGIGHYMGLDVHDVGVYTEPLKNGDVFTIEPGVYIPQEGIGVRIEDDYWMTEKGIICLSEDIPKSVKEIEKIAKQKFE